jgi:hypothetical protein
VQSAVPQPVAELTTAATAATAHRLRIAASDLHTGLVAHRGS